MPAIDTGFFNELPPLPIPKFKKAESGPASQPSEKTTRGDGQVSKRSNTTKNGATRKAKTAQRKRAPSKSGRKNTRSHARKKSLNESTEPLESINTTSNPNPTRPSIAAIARTKAIGHTRSSTDSSTPGDARAQMASDLIQPLDASDLSALSGMNYEKQCEAVSMAVKTIIFDPNFATFAELYERSLKSLGFANVLDERLKIVEAATTSTNGVT
jgi:hypothetical protein